MLDVPETVQVEIADKNGRVHVLLDAGGDHIVTKFMDDPKRGLFVIMMPCDSFGFDRAVERAKRAKVFL